jgi:hypothetical protein
MSRLWLPSLSRSAAVSIFPNHQIGDIRTPQRSCDSHATPPLSTSLPPCSSAEQPVMPPHLVAPQKTVDITHGTTISEYRLPNHKHAFDVAVIR